MAPNEEKQKCDKCKVIINLRTSKAIFCDGDCKKAWHIAKCINISEEKYGEIVKNGEKSWFCGACKAKREKRRSLLIESTLNNNNNSNATTPKTASIPSNSQFSFDLPTTPQIITLDLLYNEIKSIKTEQFKLLHMFDSFKKTLNDYKVITENLVKENIDLKNDIKILHSKILNCENKFDKDKQNKLDNNVIINGVTEIENENIMDIVTNISKEFEVNTNNDDFEKIVRIKTASEKSGLPRGILVIFKDKSKRNKLIENRKRKVYTDTIGMTGEKKQVFISEHLTKRKQYISKIARDKKRLGLIKYVWIKNGDIFVRSTDDSKIIKIKNINQLEQIN